MILCASASSTPTSLVYVITVIGSYLLGSIPFAYIAGKMNGLDIREHGSGNVGSTNTLRVLGKKWGIIVLLFDVLKAFTAVFLVKYLFPHFLDLPKNLQLLPPMIAGFLAVLGHIYPVWLKFKGGKGVACGLGIIIGIAPELIGLAVPIFIITVAITRFVSLGSILASSSLIGFFFIFHNLNDNLALFIFLTIIAFFVIIKHKSNISRLLKGEESKISFGAKKV